MSIKFSGVQKVTARMRRSRDGAQSGAVRATRALAHEVFRASQTRVPVETGTLKASGKVHETLAGKTFKVSITYGAKDARNSAHYAVFVHEDLEKKHAPPTGAKFLEDPWLAMMPGALGEYKKIVWNSIEAEVHRG